MISPINLHFIDLEMEIKDRIDFEEFSMAGWMSRKFGTMQAGRQI